ncbi:MAG: response regulator [Anaerolineae bacterium]|nr:response regulator [Anaerolineae bacterium]
MLSRKEFLKHLREALNHLYDPKFLRQSPLADLFGLAERFDTSSQLQSILIEAIETLQTEAEASSLSPNRRIYELLLYRYVEHFSQKEVADQFDVSVRHLRREQDAALEVLAYRLWEQFHLETEIGKKPKSQTDPIQTPTADAAVNDELAWLKNVPPESTTDLQQTLPVVLDLVRPLATQHGVRLEVSIANDLPALVIHLVALRQILLNLLTVAIDRSPGGKIIISAQFNRWEVQIQLQCSSCASPATPFSDQQKTSLEMTQQMVSLSGGQLTLSKDNVPFKTTLTLPAVEQTPVLAIDDNADTLQLLQRYTTGSRYRLVSTQDPEQALNLVEQLQPQIIVLDVMMPQIDGWELLGRLRQHPAAEHTPIIVCTILAQEELALSLGADAFIPKPVQRQAFLAALERQIEMKGTEPR